MWHLISSFRVTLACLAVCVAGYTAIVLGCAQTFWRASANGSLLVDASGQVQGSRLIGQAFTQNAYFWPRPSAVDYNASASGGSNKSPTSSELTERARQLVQRFGASPATPLPAALATASGSGLDPHITERSARFQIERVRHARGWEAGRLEQLIAEHARAPCAFLGAEKIVNVLELNLALDARDLGR